jgi:hypothetical protein
LRIRNRQNNNLSSRRSVNNSRRSPGKLRLRSSYNMRISNRQNNSLSSSRRRSAGNLPLAADATSTTTSTTGGTRTISTAEGEPGQETSV